jgi:hypothetical protein
MAGCNNGTPPREVHAKQVVICNLHLCAAYIVADIAVSFFYAVATILSVEDSMAGFSLSSPMARPP